MHKNLLDKIGSKGIMKKLCSVAVSSTVSNDITEEEKNGKGGGFARQGNFIVSTVT